MNLGNISVLRFILGSFNPLDQMKKPYSGGSRRSSFLSEFMTTTNLIQKSKKWRSFSF
jgi:hypothetical protein